MRRVFEKKAATSNIVRIAKMRERKTTGLRWLAWSM